MHLILIKANFSLSTTAKTAWVLHETMRRHVQNNQVAVLGSETLRRRTASGSSSIWVKDRRPYASGRPSADFEEMPAGCGRGIGLYGKWIFCGGVMRHAKCKCNTRASISHTIKIDIGARK